MSELENICKKLNKSNDGIISVSVVNIKDGTIMADSYAESTQQYKDEISGAVMNIFKGQQLPRAGELISELKKQEINSPFKEIFISSNSSLYFIRLLEKTEAVLFIVARKTVNQGLIWSEIKRAVQEISI